MSNTTLRNALALSVLVNVGVLAGLGWQKLSRDGRRFPPAHRPSCRASCN